MNDSVPSEGSASAAPGAAASAAPHVAASVTPHSAAPAIPNVAAPAVAAPVTVTARFTVTGWNPSHLPDLDGDSDWVGAVVMQKTYTAGLVGTSVAEFLSSGTEESGRGYLAAERITGTLDDGRSGSFTVHHGALQHPSDPSAFGYIVPGTGTADFAAFAGSARIEHDDTGAFFVFTLEP